MSVIVDSWAEYRRRAREGGLAEAEIDAAIAEMKREAACLDRLECPKCGGKVTRSRDPRQQGLSEVPGVWMMYRCERGDLLADRKEIEPGTAS